MKLTWPGAVKAPAGTEETHVLHWVPGYLASDGRGTWDLQGVRAYDAGENGSGCPRTWAPRDTGPETLADWIAGQLGYPVTLRLDWAEISLPGSMNSSREPLYYVSRAGE